MTAVLRLLRSPALAVGLLLAIAAVAASGSVREEVFSNPVFVLPVILASLNVALCTWQRFAGRGPQRQDPEALPSFCTERRVIRRLSARRGADLALHASLILVFAGGAIKGGYGSAAARNVAVGTEIATLSEGHGGRDLPLGFTLRVEELREARYPVRVVLGVREAGSGRKIARLEIAEGERGRIAGSPLFLEVVGYENEAGVVRVRASGVERSGEILLGTRRGQEASREVDGYRVSLLAWRSDVRSIGARVKILERGEEVAEGWLEPNGRFSHRGTALSLTAWGVDEFGIPYCGIQAVRDPGAPIFWTGCILLALAVPALLILKGRRPSSGLREGLGGPS